MSYSIFLEEFSSR